VIPFVDLLSNINRIIDVIIKCSPAFHIYYEGGGSTDNIDIPKAFVMVGGKRKEVNRFNLLPQDDWFSEQEHNEWYYKMICFIAANRDVRLQKEFYEHTDWLDVFKQYVLVYADEVSKQSM